MKPPKFFVKAVGTLAYGQQVVSVVMTPSMETHDEADNYREWLRTKAGEPMKRAMVRSIYGRNESIVNVLFMVVGTTLY